MYVLLAVTITSQEVWSFVDFLPVCTLSYALQTIFKQWTTMLQVVLANWIIIPSMIALHIVLFMVKH